MAARTRCLGVDDHPVVRQGLALLFNGNEDFELVATVKTGEEAIEAIEKYQPQGFEVLAFPANEFGSQEPGDNPQIKEFCTTNYKVGFPLFSKIVVDGPGIH